MKILIKAIAGSHLFGTDTPASDTDYKGVYLPSGPAILLGEYDDTFISTTGDSDTRNSKEDIDIELYSYRKFLKMVKKGDTAALELLFTPEEFIIEKDPIWDEIVKNRDKLLSKKVSGIIGYARQQANKYGIKGSRMGELSKVIEELKAVEKLLSFENPKLKHAWLDIVEAVKSFDHVNIIELQTTKDGEPIPAIEILGKKFDYHCTFIHVLQILKKIYKNYGHRAREARKNNGIDWKALSHAVRVSLQGCELLATGKITLPLKEEDRKLVKSIKVGEVNYKDVAKLIETQLEFLENCSKNSTLPEELDNEYINSCIISYHRMMVN